MEFPAKHIDRHQQVTVLQEELAIRYAKLQMQYEAFSPKLSGSICKFFSGEWDNDKNYMSRFFEYASINQIGLGGPDVVSYKKAHMKNCYPFFKENKENIFVSMAIQEPDYTYTNPKTNANFTFVEFYDFAKNYLGADILFWNTEEPFYSKNLLPNLNKSFFDC